MTKCSVNRIEKQNNNTKLEAVLLMYRNWEEHAAIEVAGARIGSVVSFVESSRARAGPVQGLPSFPG